MDQEKERYDNLMKSLRRSQPYMGDAERFSEKVIGRISQERTSVSVPELIYEFIFGWVYVGWMRLSMVTAAICLLLYFGYQQTVILKRIEALSSRSLVDVDLTKLSASRTLPSRMKMFTVLGKSTGQGKIEISEKELDKFIESINDLEVRYKDIFRRIETDPELKKYVEDRLNRSVSVKPKI